MKKIETLEEENAELKHKNRLMWIKIQQMNSVVEESKTYVKNVSQEVYDLKKQLMNSKRIEKQSGKSMSIDLNTNLKTEIGQFSIDDIENHLSKEATVLQSSIEENSSLKEMISSENDVQVLKSALYQYQKKMKKM